MGKKERKERERIWIRIKSQAKLYLQSSLTIIFQLFQLVNLNLRKWIIPPTIILILILCVLQYKTD